jgi:NAD(P)-dependent dehydrogenase (short-subunit alcohol dehydrogenase family)
MGRLEGKAILITGASRGIGLAMARALDREGAKLILVGRNRVPLARAAAQLPGTVMSMPVDVTKPGDVKRLMAAVQKQIRRLDVLINNAGVFTFKPFARTTLEDWRRNLETNLTSIFLTTQAALPLLQRSQGDVVNILSVGDKRPKRNCFVPIRYRPGLTGYRRTLEWRPGPEAQSHRRGFPCPFSRRDKTHGQLPQRLCPSGRG